MLLAYDWPGNVRELENTVEYLLNLAPEEEAVGPDLLPPQMRVAWRDDEFAVCSLRSLERENISRALFVFGHSVEGKRMAASQLGISLSTLYRKMKNYNLLD